MPKQGIYWVKLYSYTVERKKIDKWIVAEYAEFDDNYYMWQLLGDEEFVGESMVAEIGPEILPPSEE